MVLVSSKSVRRITPILRLHLMVFSVDELSLKTYHTIFSSLTSVLIFWTHVGFSTTRQDSSTLFAWILYQAELKWAPFFPPSHSSPLSSMSQLFSVIRNRFSLSLVQSRNRIQLSVNEGEESGTTTLLFYPTTQWDISKQASWLCFSHISSLRTTWRADISTHLWVCSTGTLTQNYAVGSILLWNPLFCGMPLAALCRNEEALAVL